MGISLHPVRRCADDGQLFTMQEVSFRMRITGDCCDVGPLAEVAGADVPERLTQRSGGDAAGNSLMAARVCGG